VEPLLQAFPGLKGFPWRDLGVRPTPLEEARIGGRALLVKRDDRTSPLYGGNKPRTLEFLLALPAKRILTFSSLSAHHAWATALFARELGLETDVVLVRRGLRGELASRLREVARRVVEAGSPAAAAFAAARIWRPGTRILPPGGLSPRGALGYVAAAFELEVIPPRIYVPLGTGTTVSGLLAGLALRGAACEVVAVRLADYVTSLPWLLFRRAKRAAALLRRHDPRVPRPEFERVTLRVVKADGAYGKETASAREAIALARSAGLLLDPTYSGKTLALLLRESPQDALFWLTYAASDRGRRADPPRPG
jgi:D-cysteine desulfhydrase